MDIIQKKIAVLCNYQLLPTRVGGMDYFFWEFDKKCKENNVEVNWFFPNIATHGNYSNLAIISSKNKNVESFFANSISEKNQEYFVIMTHFVEVCSPVFKKIKLNSKARIIAIDHNPRPLNGYSLKKQIAKKIKGLFYSKYIDLFIGVSRYTSNEIIKDFGNQVKSKTKTIYNGVILNTIQFRKQRNTVNPKFIVVSHLRKSKGIQDLIEAVSLLEDIIKNQLKIVVYGDGPYKNELLAKISMFQLEHIFEFKGSVSNLKDLYHNYDYMLQPTHMECFSLSILESLAANVPVITTNVGGNEEAIHNGQNGIIFKAKDVIALSQIIRKLTIGEISITENTRTLIENKFCLEKMVDTYYKLIS